MEDSGEDAAIRSNIRETIRDVFGENSSEFREYRNLSIWAGPMSMGMSDREIIDARQRGKVAVRITLENLIARLFSDPDANAWLLQEVKTRAPGR